jgi:nucleotidyltransferase/DNA polymerase involved in DNA repair
MRAPCTRRSRSSRPIYKPTGGCSKASPTGATATRRWSPGRGDGLFLDITGCAHLFGGERAMLDDLLARLFHQGFDVRAGLASTPGAAWAAARFPVPVDRSPGEEAEALAPLPLAALRLEPAVRAGLESVGLRTTAASSCRRPRAPLVRRFGNGGRRCASTRRSAMSRRRSRRGCPRSGDIALFTDRVRARLGDHAIHRPRLLESHWPERAVMPAPFSAPHAPGSDKAQVDALWRNGSKERPIRLLDPPEWIDVTLAEVPEGPPGRFRWRHASYRVASAEGPERIAPEWWRESLPAVEKKEQEENKDYERRRKQATVEKTLHLTRDYFRIEDSDGRRYWLYRQGLYGMSKEPPRWYMQGLFA